MHWHLGEGGWHFPTLEDNLPGENTIPDPLYNAKHLSEIYLRANPNYAGRYTVPVLWDKKHETIVNNESSEIIRMLYTQFDAAVEDKYKGVEFLKGKGEQIDEMNKWIYDGINNGVYKSGFATSVLPFFLFLFFFFFFCFLCAHYPQLTPSYTASKRCMRNMLKFFSTPSTALKKYLKTPMEHISSVENLQRLIFASIQQLFVLTPSTFSTSSVTSRILDMDIQLSINGSGICIGIFRHSTRQHNLSISRITILKATFRSIHM